MSGWLAQQADIFTQGDVSALGRTLILIITFSCCSLYGLVQFLSMLMSRWGDRNPAPKAFVLSLLLHSTLIMAWYMGEIIWPYSLTRGLPSNVAGAASIPVRELTESDLDDPFESGNTSIFQQVNELPDREMSRQERPEESTAELDEAPLTPADLLKPKIDPTELAEVSAESPAAAVPDQAPSPDDQKNKPAAAPVPAAQQESTAERRADVGARAPIRTKPRTDSPVDLAEEAPKTRGSADLAAQMRPDDVAMSIPVDRDYAEDSAATIPEAQPSETVRKGAAPAPSSAPEGEFVAGGETTSESTKPRVRKFNRSQLPTNAESDGESLLPEAVTGEGRPVATTGPERTVKSINSAPGDQTDVSPVPALAPANIPNLPNRSPATYKLRKLEQRRGTALKQGGSLESERAVENSLRWLARVQEPEGYWDADAHGGGAVQKDPHGNDRRGGGTHADSGITGLALLAFMGAGYTQEDGDYSLNVSRGLKWLIDQQRDDGYLGGNATHFDQMYCHAIATIALAEACGMQDEAARSTDLRRAVRTAVEYIVKHQGPDGGWRYKLGQEGDMSMFGWQLMALKSADIAGVKARPDAWYKMIEFLKNRSLGEQGGLAAYNLNQPQPTSAMTAEALFCKQMIGIKRSNPACQEAVAYIRKQLPRVTAYDEYYWYYGTMSMFQHGGDAWDEWNQTTRDLLVRQQLTSGKHAGSWEPRGKWAGNGGRIYSTALSTLCLEVYYRYLPLYQTTQE